MATRMPNAEIVDDTPIYMLYRDIGPWDQHPTITNRVEEFVAAIVGYGHLGDRRLFYYDSEGDLTEILIEDGHFAGFKDTSALPVSL